MKQQYLIGVVIATLLLSACSPAAQAPAPTAAPTEAPTAAPAPAPTAPPQAAAAPLDPAAAATWDAVLTQWMAPNNGVCDAPGGVLLVDTPAGRYLKAAGVASLDDQRAVEVTDRFQIGSNTKAFTVILALLLQEEGVLSLDDSLREWLPDLAARIPNGDQATLRQLAGNTSGIPDFADPLMQPLINANDQEGIARAYTPAELVDFAIANGTPDFAPGEGWHYSSTNFILLGMAVEAAAGRPLAVLYQERIFDPLGMAATSYLEGSPAPGSSVDGYYNVPDVGLTNMTGWNATQGGAAGAIVSTAEDMARFIDGLFGGKIFANPATLNEMTAMRPVRAEEGGGLIQGYGLGLIGFPTPGFSAIGHEGQTPGFQSIWMRVPEADSTLVFLTNSGTCSLMLLPPSLSAEGFGQ